MKPVIRTKGNDEHDPRNFRSVILPDYTLESLSALPEGKYSAAASLLSEAIEFQDDEMFDEVCRRIAFESTKEGKLRDHVAKIAITDQALENQDRESTRMEV